MILVVKHKSKLNAHHSRNISRGYHLLKIWVLERGRREKDPIN